MSAGTPPVRCERRYPHGPHTYVATPRSEVDLQCPGRPMGARSVAELLAARPALADLPLVGAVRHALEVSAA